MPISALSLGAAQPSELLIAGAVFWRDQSQQAAQANEACDPHGIAIARPEAQERPNQITHWFVRRTVKALCRKHAMGLAYGCLGNSSRLRIRMRPSPRFGLRKQHDRSGKPSPRLSKRDTQTGDFAGGLGCRTHHLTAFAIPRLSTLRRSCRRVSPTALKAVVGGLHGPLRRPCLQRLARLGLR